MLLARGAALGLATAALAACPADQTAPCLLDATTPMALVFADRLGVVHDLIPGGEIALMTAPQGGYIALIAVRLELPVERCELQVAAALRDPANGRVIGLEQRPITIVRRPDGWLAPPSPSGLSGLANLGVCPTAASSTDIHGHPFQLEVRALRMDESAAVMAVETVVPTCASEGCAAACALQP